MTEAKRSKKADATSFGQAGVRTRSRRGATKGKLVERPHLLIVCEGAKTETNYFKAFKVTNEVYGKGLNTLSLIVEAERRQKDDGSFDQIWCVFDRDSFPAADFDNAIDLAQS